MRLEKPNTANYFAFYDFPIKYDLDDSLLKQAYLSKSKLYHPDFYSDNFEDQAIAIGASSFNNNAYKTLNNPILRAQYIVDLQTGMNEQTVQLPNDHIAKARPEDGYTSAHSFMADNDLALGRILHFLSRTKYWKNMLVIITEDDPQGGVDHIDAHRSILMMAGPYVKKGYLSKTHANFGAILKTIYNISGVPYVNQYDVTASLLQDFFTDQPDYTPYTLEMNDTRIFDVNKAMKKYKTTIDWNKILKGPEMDKLEDMRADHYRQQKEGTVIK